jgi:hypothetical protein
MWIGLWRPGVSLHERLIDRIQHPGQAEYREDGVPPAAVIVVSTAPRTSDESGKRWRD